MEETEHRERLGISLYYDANWGEWGGWEAPMQTHNIGKAALRFCEGCDLHDGDEKGAVASMRRALGRM